MTHAIFLIFLLPFLGGAATCLPTGKLQASLGMAGAVATVAAVALLAFHLYTNGAQHYRIGGQAAPLGIQLHADGLGLAMLLLTALTGLLVSIYSLAYFKADEKKTARNFWPLWLLLWGGLNCLFVSADLFNIYLLLEFTLLAAVALATLGGSAAGHVSALRYLLAATGAGVFYLLGTGLIYSEARTLDFHLLRDLAPDGFVPLLALGLMLASLLLKSALFPLHFWLPAAHSTAPAPVSAVLSALVVKAGFYVIARLWFFVTPQAAAPAAAHLLGGLGAIAILWGAWQALRQERLKMLVAYSTVSQVGYLFLLFPLATSHGTKVLGAMTYQALSHGFAKAAMFMAAGALLKSAHSDAIARTRGTARQAPFAVAAFILSGAALAGIAPGGGSKGKLLEISHAAAHWWWSAVIIAGMLLAAGYTVAGVRKCFLRAVESAPGRAPRLLELSALALASASIALSFHSDDVIKLLKITGP